MCGGFERFLEKRSDVNAPQPKEYVVLPLPLTYAHTHTERRIDRQN